MRLLFGKQFSFDHPEFYETCARTRTYEEHMARKNFCLEHTKPLFNEYDMLSLNNLHIFHTFIKLYSLDKLNLALVVLGLRRRQTALYPMQFSTQNRFTASTSPQNDVFASNNGPEVVLCPD